MSVFSNFINTSSHLHSIKLVDVQDDKTCWFQCIHGYSSFYKTPRQIIENQFIINKVSSVDASLLGVVCGEVYQEHLMGNKITNLPINLKLDAETSGVYNLLFIDRNGMIFYENLLQEKLQMSCAIELVKNKKVIENFTNNNAFYLGYLAGIELIKIKTKLTKKIMPHKPNLKLVYSR